MAKQSFVRASNYSSTDWHDMATVMLQLQDGDNYAIEDPHGHIAAHIHSYIKTMVSPDVTVDTIKSIMEGKEDVYIDTVVPTREEKDGIINVSPDRIKIFAKGDSGLGYEPMFDSVDFTDITKYRIDEIESEKVEYLVSEHIVNAGKGSDLIERLYHEPFKSLEEAIAYRDEQMKDYEHKGHAWHGDSGYKISVVDGDAIRQTTWYKDNMLALDYMNRLGLDSGDYRFYRSAHGVVETLQEQIYEQSSPEEKLAIDKEIYSKLKGFLSDEHQHDIELVLQSCDSKFSTTSSREIVDRALVLAHVDATSQADYDAIHKSLGEYESRLQHLTRKNVKEMRGNGHACVSKDGTIGYYRDAYGISDWKGSLDNPYHGTMFYNMGSTIDIFRDFRHHDKFVDVLPEQSLVDEYNVAYHDWEAKRMRERAKSEVKYEIQQKNGKDYIVAPGYTTCTGSYAICEYHDEPVRFAAQWGTYRFTDDDIRSLLIGDEITINVVNKMGEVVPVRGDLSQNHYHGHSYMGFSRTDIYGKNYESGAGKFYIELSDPSAAAALRQKASDITDSVGDALGIDETNQRHGVFIAEPTQGANGKYYVKVGFSSHKDHPKSNKRYCSAVMSAVSDALHGNEFAIGEQKCISPEEMSAMRNPDTPTMDVSHESKTPNVQLNESLLTEMENSMDKSMGPFS